MKILVVGSGGREHAIVAAIRRSAGRHTVFTAPGNAGTAELCTNVAISADAIDDLVAFAEREAVDLVVVGPEVPLVLGLADRLREKGIPVVGPSAAAAQLEGSKSFAKNFMARHGIPTADYRTFGQDDAEAARDFVRRSGTPIVVKASGLAAGKGAVVCMTETEAFQAITAILEEGSLGSAGHEIVLESFMEGEEASVFAFTDGTDYVLLPTAQDHKPIGDGDKGPNTGGMGAYAPAPLMTPELIASTCRTIVEPTLTGMHDEGMPYTGILYVGLMISGNRPKVVEYNCRLGDPEAQVVLPLLASDAVDLFHRVATGNLKNYSVSLMEGAAACVVMASSGYPGAYEKGKPIAGLDAIVALPDVAVFQAGVGVDASGHPITAGGRVLAVTGVGEDLRQAIARAYEGVDHISFEGQTFRTDIGAKGLARLGVGT